MEPRALTASSGLALWSQVVGMNSSFRIIEFKTGGTRGSTSHKFEVVSLE